MVFCKNIENLVGKGENSSVKHFLFSLQCFHKVSYFLFLNTEIVRQLFLLQTCADRIPTPEKSPSIQSPKPQSAMSKNSPPSPHSQLSPQEPLDSSIGDLKRENSYNSTQTLLTAPTPGTNVTDFERPPSKGSYQSMDNISVSVSTLPRGSFSTDSQRPLSISSVKPIICTPPPHHLCKETQTGLPSVNKCEYLVTFYQTSKLWTFTKIVLGF